MPGNIFNKLIGQPDFTISSSSDFLEPVNPRVAGLLEIECLDTKSVIVNANSGHFAFTVQLGKIIVRGPSPGLMSAIFAEVPDPVKIFTITTLWRKKTAVEGTNNLTFFTDKFWITNQLARAVNLFSEILAAAPAEIAQCAQQQDMIKSASDGTSTPGVN